MEKDELIATSPCNATQNGMGNFKNTDSSFAETNSTNDRELEINGDYSNNLENNGGESSESDALVIDESVNTRVSKNKRKKIKLKVGKKGKSLNNNSKVDVEAFNSDYNTSGENSDLNSEIKNTSDLKPSDIKSDNAIVNKKSNSALSDSPRPNNQVNNAGSQKEAEPHSNPFFHESLFDLSQKTRPKKAKKKKRSKDGGGSTGATQYLGLQPSVQFKCSKCGQNGFESLALLQQHANQCNESAVSNASVENPNNGFKLTRKVFLCSACGTYYESWNLYMHMLEFHRRYICLYCLGMFSVLQDLCQHIQNRHNIEPGVKNSPDEFFNTYNEPCYLSCCECSKLFSEQDDFFYHNCSSAGGSSKKRFKVATATATVIELDNHVTGESSIAPSNDEADEDKRQDETYGLPQNESQSHQNDENDIDKSPPLESMETNIDDVEGSVEKNDKKMSPLSEEPVETRKVPKLSLKLPKFTKIEEVVEEDEEVNNSEEEEEEEEIAQQQDNDSESKKVVKSEDLAIEKHHLIEDETIEEDKEKIVIAGEDVPIIELQLEQPLDKFDIRVLIQKCLSATVPICIYCNHARKIAVNGKQLGLHAIAEHRYSAIVNSITAEELIPDSFNNRIKESLDELEKVYFNLESSPTENAITFSHMFECFPCRYSTPVHKELYLHNRKLHAKNLLLCIMCKSSFYNYSELLCHLCPGQYELDCDLQFRCCLCVSDDLPSAFRLMVHLRKRHNVCDVCLEMCHDQSKLSNHVWKHKLHHFCYRCCIAYRNKPDITRHLFWKHGTESIVCKKCMQKKWPHVYHFCVPPSNFTCDECNLTFSKAMYLKVHKRSHSDDGKKFACTFEGCEEKFISRKLMMKHEMRHNESDITQDSEKEMEVEQPVEEMNVISSEEAAAVALEEHKKEEQANEDTKPGEEVEEDKPKPKIDVYDLPELNLSESDSSDSESEQVKSSEATEERTDESLILPTATTNDVEESDEKPQAIENIWDDFKNYQATKEKLDNLFNVSENSEGKYIEEKTEFVDTSLIDHDYCMDPEKKTTDTSLIEVKPDLTLTERVDHDYCSPKGDKAKEKKEDGGGAPEAEPKQRKRSNSASSSSSSSSSGTSSSCSCGSNCSCTSSSGSSSSSSDSSESDSSTEEGRKKQQLRRRQRFKDKMERKNANKADKQNAQLEESKEVIDVINNEKLPVEVPIRESDLETTESETDEEFYDKQPQKLAKKILEEKRQQLLAEMGPNLINGGFMENTSRPPTPPNYETEKEVRKKKSKSKKRKKKKSNKQRHIPQYQPTVAPITLSLKNSPLPTVVSQASIQANENSNAVDNDVSVVGAGNSKDDSHLRASKRRRVPNKFYGYSSDEEDTPGSERPPAKWRKIEVNASPKTVPPITIKTALLSASTVAKTPPLPPLPSQPTVEPISIRSTSTPGELRVQPRKVPPLKVIPPRPPPTLTIPTNPASLVNNPQDPNAPFPPKPQLYCYCRCPYDEVSEMIGCDSNDCAIEWFHFECVGIMVPPKGQWFCPDCRKKKQQQQQQQQKRD